MKIVLFLTLYFFSIINGTQAEDILKISNMARKTHPIKNEYPLDKNYYELNSPVNEEGIGYEMEVCSYCNVNQDGKELAREESLYMEDGVSVNPVDGVDLSGSDDYAIKSDNTLVLSE